MEAIDILKQVSEVRQDLQGLNQMIDRFAELENEMSAQDYLDFLEWTKKASNVIESWEWYFENKCFCHD